MGETAWVMGFPAMKVWLGKNRSGWFPVTEQASEGLKQRLCLCWGRWN